MAKVGQPLNPVGPGLHVSGRGIVQSCLFAIGQLDLHFGCEDEGDFILDGETPLAKIKNLVCGGADEYHWEAK